MKIFINI